ncbi:MAG: hypothetical protein KGL53_09845, partial [Elusimicrobia bacterium]|nr:hypothetical protein [Elusimicrobiota bacterium]
MALTTVSGWKSYEFSGAQRDAQKTALEIFYGDDLFIFSDSYMDPSIPRLVLPILKRWNETGKAAESDLAAAIQVLRNSPDPKADNVLETVFKRADLLPLSDASETLLLKTLIERDDPSVWSFLEQYMAAHGQDQKAEARLIKMIDLGAAIGSESVFQNIFHFLKSPDDAVRQEAAKSLHASLSAPAAAARFMDRLKAVAQKYQADPVLNLWVEFFTLDRLAAADARTVDVSDADALLSQAAANSQKGDAARLGELKQAGPGQEDKLTAPAAVQAFGLMGQMLQRAQQQGVNADPLSLAVRQQADLAVKALVKEAVADFPTLKAVLQKDGVMLADPAPAPAPAQDQYDDYEGYGGDGSYVDPDAVYRDHYTLAQLQTLAADLAAARAQAGRGLTLPQDEYLDRAMKTLAALAPAAEAAGMPQGGTPGDAAAVDVNAVLMQAHSSLPSSSFLAEMRQAGLAPDAKVNVDAARSFRQTYAAADILKVRALMSKLLADGQTHQDGQAYTLSWAQKKGLAADISALDAALAKDFPSAPRPAGALDAATAAVSAALKSGDAAALSSALSGLAQAYEAAPVKDAALARFLAAEAPADKSLSDASRLALLDFWLARVEESGAALDPAGAAEALALGAPSKMSAAEALKGYDLLARRVAADRAA